MKIGNITFNDNFAATLYIGLIISLFIGYIANIVSLLAGGYTSTLVITFGILGIAMPPLGVATFYLSLIFT
jgi:cation transporter-like permease